MKEFIDFLKSEERFSLLADLESYTYRLLSEVVVLITHDKDVKIYFGDNSSHLNIGILRSHFESKIVESNQNSNVLVESASKLVNLNLKEIQKYDLVIALGKTGNDNLKYFFHEFYSKSTNITYLKNIETYNDAIEKYFNRWSNDLFIPELSLLNDYFNLFHKIRNNSETLNSFEQSAKIHQEKIKVLTGELEKQHKVTENLRIKNENIKNQLSYRVGSTIVKTFSEKKNLIYLPYYLSTEIKEFYKDKKDLPKIIKLSNALKNPKFGSKNNNIFKKEVLGKKHKNQELIVSVDVYNFINNYNDIRISYFKKSDLKGLYDITYKTLNDNLKKFEIFEPILNEVLQILFFIDNEESNKLERYLLENFLVLFLSKKNIKKVTALIIDFISVLGIKDFQKILNRFSYNMRDIYQTEYFLDTLILKPQAVLPLLNEDFYEWMASQKETYSLVVAKFLFSSIKLNNLTKNEVDGFFNIKRIKLKKRFLNLMQRYSYTIKRAVSDNDIVLESIKKIQSHEDLLYVALLVSFLSSDPVKNEFKSKVEEFNSNNILLPQELAYLYSQIGDNILIKNLVNQSYFNSNIKTINDFGDNGLSNIYENINNLDINKEDINTNFNSKESVNIIICTFNPNLSLLEFSLNSVLNQTYKQLIITVVDDFSTNSTEIKNLISSLNDERIKYLRMPRNSGVYECRNFAIISSSTNFIAFQDDDDVSHPQRIEYQLNHLKDNNLEVSMATNLRIDLDGHVQIDNNYSILSNGPVTMLFSKQLIEKIGFFKNVRSRGDVEFKNRCIRLLGPSALEVSPKILYFSLGSHNSLSSTFEHGRNYSSLKLIRSLIHYDETISSSINKKYSNCNEPVVVCMTSFPARKEKMLSTIDSIAGNVDRIYLYLNNYEKPPKELKKYNNLEIILGINARGDLRDNGKIYPFSVKEINGYCFLIDDDIIYPLSYFSEFIRKIEKYNRKAVVGVHGVIFAKPFISYFNNREVFHFKNENEKDIVVNQLGTGALAFHTDTLKPNFSKYTETGMADVFFAIEAKELRVPLVCISHPAGWLKPLDIEIEDQTNLYDEFKNDHSTQTRLIASAGEFNEIEISKLLLE